MVETLCRKLTIIETIKFVILAIVIYALLSQAWDWMHTTILEAFNWPDNAWSKFKITLMFVVLTIISFGLLRVDPVFILGVNTHCLSLE
jgi:hypothetical protein